jgi:hypothetical protein
MSTTFIDFGKVRAAHTFDQIFDMLGMTELNRSKPDRVSGRCPVCKNSSFKYTPSKGLCNCFTPGCPVHGDQIALVAATRGYEGKGSMRKAAEEIATHFGPVHISPPAAISTVPNSSPSPQPSEEKRELQPLSYLEAAHESVNAIGISAETARAWGAGYAPKGIMRGRFAVPIHDRGGKLLAYVGIAVTSEQSPKLHYPNGFDPHSVIFAAERVEAGELYLVRDPLQVLTAYENGIENVVAFLAPITAQMLEQLASLMDEKKIETIELY